LIVRGKTEGTNMWVGTGRFYIDECAIFNPSSRGAFD
jgi:hypothetical protein